MCQLLGMNCNVPTDICFSFEGFHRRGGLTDDHADGWGIAFFEGAGCRIFLDDKPAAQSPIAALVRQYPIRSLNVVAHIRKATRGAVALENTHPFVRELWGRYWIFAHNGTLDNFVPPSTAIYYHPVGGTDSEAAFCHLLEQLRVAFPQRPPDAELLAALRDFSAALAALGVFNYLLSDGESLFAYCADRLCYIVRRAPFARAHLIDEDMTVDFSEVTTPRDQVAIVATSPLTDNETWTSMPARQLLMFRAGEPVVA